MTIELTPIQLVWLHSQHIFQKIEEDGEANGDDIKFYKNNSGVELRFQRQSETTSLDPLVKAKD